MSDEPKEYAAPYNPDVLVNVLKEDLFLRIPQYALYHPSAAVREVCLSILEKNVELERLLALTSIKSELGVNEFKFTSFNGDPLDAPLPGDVVVGHVTMRRGVRLRTLVGRMKALYKLATGYDADEVANRSMAEREVLFSRLLLPLEEVLPPEATLDLTPIGFICSNETNGAKSCKTWCQNKLVCPSTRLAI